MIILLFLWQIYKLGAWAGARRSKLSVLARSEVNASVNKTDGDIVKGVVIAYMCHWCVWVKLLGHPPLVGKALNFTHELSFFYQSTMFSSHTEDSHQMYFRGSIVGKASTVGIGISPTFPTFFTGVQNKKKCEIWRCLKHHSTLSHLHLKMQQDIRILKQKCNADRPMSWPSLVKLGPHIPEKALSVLTHPLKLHAKTR